MNNSRTLKLVTGIGEGILAIPILGGIIVVSFSWVPLIIMLILHIITFVACANDRTSKVPSILGIITSAIGWIPILGWCMHVVSAILLLLAALKKSQ